MGSLGHELVSPCEHINDMYGMRIPIAFELLDVVGCCLVVVFPSSSSFVHCGVLYLAEALR